MQFRGILQHAHDLFGQYGLSPVFAAQLGLPEFNERLEAQLGFKGKSIWPKLLFINQLGFLTAIIIRLR